jgi:hypothetical protein
MNTFPSEIEHAFKNMTGLNCCRQRVVQGRPLSIGLGEKVFHNKKNSIDSHYGTWEFGTYCASWRVTKLGRILCGSNDIDVSTEELDQRLNNIVLGKLLSVRMVSAFDVSFDFENQISIDFLGTFSDDEHTVHIFGPDKLYISFSSIDMWKVTTSDKT